MTTRIMMLSGLGALAMALIASQATASVTVSGTTRSVKPTAFQYAACMVQGSGGRSYSCDTLGGGAYKGKTTKKGHAQTKKPSSSTNK